MHNETDMFSLLQQLPPQGLSIEQLAALNDAAEGFTKTLGLRLTEVSPDFVRSQLHVSDAHLQPAGIVNGGVYSSIAETAGSIAGMIAAKGENVVGINCNCDFLGQVSAGVIEAEAKVIHPGRSTQLVKIKMFHRGKMVARATLRTMVLQRPKEAPKKDKF